MWGLLKSILWPGNGRELTATSAPHDYDMESGTPVLDISTLSYVPLPRAPLQWETKQTLSAPAATNDFEIHDATWQIIAVEKIPKEQRPDPAFRNIYPTSAGLFMVDDLGKAAGLGPLKSAILYYDREGAPGGTVGLQHDAYRTAAHPMGRAIAMMARDCVLYAYDEELHAILTTDLMDVPEIAGLRHRFGIPDDKVKNHIRCVALSRAEGRYLFTAVDGAYCHDMDGNRLWSVKLPIKDGWTRVSTASTRVNTSKDVLEALTLMGLGLPLAPERLKSRYRELAKKWHPDLNPNDTKAGANMRALTSAIETLTGIDAAEVSDYAGAVFAKELGRFDTDVEGADFTITASLQVGELFAADWIYAAAFAAGSDAVYLAGYSGKVFVLDEQGTGLRVYDIGAVPSQIIDTGDYLYLLTSTRLYILRGEELHALIDVYGAGELIMAQTGFGFLQSKSLRWYADDGQHLGTVVTKDPIRMVYQRGSDTVIETRQRRAVIQGIPRWW